MPHARRPAVTRTARRIVLISLCVPATYIELEPAGEPARRAHGQVCTFAQHCFSLRRETTRIIVQHEARKNAERHEPVANAAHDHQLRGTTGFGPQGQERRGRAIGLRHGVHRLGHRRGGDNQRQRAEVLERRRKGANPGCDRTALRVFGSAQAGIGRQGAASPVVRRIGEGMIRVRERGLEQIGFDDVCRTVVGGCVGFRESHHIGVLLRAIEHQSPHTGMEA